MKDCDEIAQMNFYEGSELQPNISTVKPSCANGHLYSETTCIKRPLCDVPKVSAPYILTCIERPPLYKGHYEVALAWPFNTGFTVINWRKWACNYYNRQQNKKINKTNFSVIIFNFNPLILYSVT